MSGRKEEKPVVKPSADDIWLAETMRQCGIEGGRWLKAGVNIDKRIGNLTMPELTGFAWACISQYILIRAAAEEAAKCKDEELIESLFV